MRPILLVVFLLFSSSCTQTMLGLYGIKRPQPISSEKDISKSSRILVDTVLVVDTNYLARLKALNLPKDIRHHCYQPLQVWLFEDGKPVFGEVNCVVSGFPNLKWTIDTHSEKPSPVLLDGKPEYLPLSNTLWERKVPQTRHREAIIVWCNYMGRQNRRFLKSVDKALDSTWHRNYYSSDNFSRKLFYK